jgi:single-stranded-DNA-specific exonuclease
MNSLSFTGQSWCLRDVSPEDSKRLENQLQLHPVVARCLAARVTDPMQARNWLRPSLDHMHDPALISGMDVAIPRIKRAVSQNERIRIVTDYDVDGTTSSLIIQGALRLLGAGNLVDYHIPDRFKEGYGFSEVAANKAADDGIGLIITADIGVRDHTAVSTAAARGVDVIICDHHLPAGEAVPTEATAVLCPPQEGCGYPNKSLAACGVSLKLAQALLEDHPKKSAIIRSMLKIAAIGTVADVVDLSTPENRAIVSFGLKSLQSGHHVPGLRALMDVSGLQGEISASDLGFRLGPRINAAGRLAQATAVIELFDERNPERARARAQALDDLNRDRQDIQRVLVQRCLEQLPESPPDFVTLWGNEADGWHRGVVGIVAAKVRDAVNRPVAIVSVSGEEARGSVRATASCHAVQALDSAADHLLAYGGHPAAAGFSVRTKHLEALREQLNLWAGEHTEPGSWTPSIQVDAICDADHLRHPDIDLLAQGLSDLGPHGKGNAAPVIQLDGVQISDPRPMGEKHLRMRIGEIDAVWWNGREHTHALTQGRISLVGSLGYNSWRGKRTVRYTVADARPFTEEPSPPASSEGL